MHKLSDIRTCEPGDVLMVSMQNTDKKTGKPYTWRFFAIVQTVHRNSVGCYRVGGGVLNQIVLSSHTLRGGKIEVMLLDDNEWPDGIWQVRTKMVLAGEISLSE